MCEQYHSIGIVHYVPKQATSWPSGDSDQGGTGLMRQVHEKRFHDKTKNGIKRQGEAPKTPQIALFGRGKGQSRKDIEHDSDVVPGVELTQLGPP